MLIEIIIAILIYIVLFIIVISWDSGKPRIINFCNIRRRIILYRQLCDKVINEELSSSEAMRQWEDFLGSLWPFSYWKGFYTVKDKRYHG